MFESCLHLLLQESVKVTSIMFDLISTSEKSPPTIQGYALAEITNDCEQGLNVSK